MGDAERKVWTALASRFHFSDDASQGMKGLLMDRDKALRLDGIIAGAFASLDRISHDLKAHASPDEYSEFIVHVGGAMAELFEISQGLYRQHPDIVPDELRPPQDD